ncbi:MAG TPA: DUF47 family protein [Gemmatimonadaceae bacterium]|nr:DUF47 family protein [Gemmatimonadaceae bacterium]
MLEHFRSVDAVVFRELNDICERLTRSANLAQELLAGERSDEDRIAGAIRASDREAHDLVADVNRQTFQSFIMRIDRMDMHALAVALDEAVEAMDDIGANAPVLHASGMGASPHLGRLAQIVTDASRELAHGVWNIGKSRGDVLRAVRAMRSLKDDGEDTYFTGMQSLFAAPPDAVEVIRTKEIYDEIAAVLNRVVGVGRALEQVAEGYA